MESEAIKKQVKYDKEIYLSPNYLSSIFLLKGPSTTLPNDVTVLTLIERQADRVPDKVALIYGEDQLSFTELNKKSNRLASLLQNLGVKRNSLVPVVCSNGLARISHRV